MTSHGIEFRRGLGGVSERARVDGAYVGTPETIWVAFTDGGGNIRRWSRNPFEGANEYRLAGIARLLENL